MGELVRARSGEQVSGRLAVLACPPALCPHVEFAAADVLDASLHLQWAPQPARPGLLCAGLEWRAAVGSAGRLAARLARLNPVWFEVYEAASTGCDAERYSAAPDLGLHRATVDAAGETVLVESALRGLLETAPREAGVPEASGVALARAIRRALGDDWDAALEPLRDAGYDAPITWLRRTG